MINAALDFYVNLFTEAFVENGDDALKMSVVQKRPFQDDPTRKAPYLILHFDEEKGTQPDTELKYEIGGPTYWKVFLKLKAAPKVQTSREKAYTLSDVLLQRTLWVLRNAYRQHTETLAGATLWQLDWNFITKASIHMAGGEREWLPHIEVYWYHRVQEPHRFGTYVSEIP